MAEEPEGCFERLISLAAGGGIVLLLLIVLL
jgi:hypothetical protein